LLLLLKLFSDRGVLAVRRATSQVSRVVLPSVDFIVISLCVVLILVVFCCLILLFD